MRVMTIRHFMPEHELQYVKDISPDIQLTVAVLLELILYLLYIENSNVPKLLASEGILEMVFQLGYPHAHG